MSEKKESLDELNFKYVLTTFLYYINDSLFYAFIIQIILVAYGYYRVGKNSYWKVLYISSWCGLIGATIEKLCMSWTGHPNNTNRYIYILYIINEPFWIISEFTIPYVNMIKLSALILKKKKKILNIYIGILFILFIVFRIRIGILRYKEMEVFNNDIYRAHGYSFMTMAVAEFSCTLLLIKSLRLDYEIAKRKGHNGTIYSYSIQSSYFILLVIDIVGFILAILSIFYNYTVKAFLVVFHCLKSNFILILAVDALILKIENMDNKIPQKKSESDHIFSSTSFYIDNTSRISNSIDILSNNNETTNKADDGKTMSNNKNKYDSKDSKLKNLLINTKKIIIVKNDDAKSEDNEDNEDNDDDDSTNDNIENLKIRNLSLFKNSVQSNSTVGNGNNKKYNNVRSATSIPDNHKYYEKFNNIHSSLSMSDDGCSSSSILSNNRINKYNNMHSEIMIRKNMELC